LAKVLAFYQDRLAGRDGAGKITPPSRRESTLDGKTAVTLSRIDGRTVIAAEIRQGDNGTILELMRIEPPTPKKGNLPGNIPGPTDVASPGTFGGVNWTD